MKPKILRTESEYESALERIDALISAESNTAEGDELELWTLLVERYEEEHHHIDLPDPIDAIRFRMEQQGLKQVDLVPLIGNKSKVSEVLNRKRSLSLAMIRNLHDVLGIPAEVLIQEEGATLSKRLLALMDEEAVERVTGPERDAVEKMPLEMLRSLSTPFTGGFKQYASLDLSNSFPVTGNTGEKNLRIDVQGLPHEGVKKVARC